MNAPERSSAFILDEDSGEMKCVYTADTKVRYGQRVSDGLYQQSVKCVIQTTNLLYLSFV